MFDGGKDDVVALVPASRGYPFKSEIVGFRAARREENFRVSGSYQQGHTRARLLDGLEGLLPGRMQALGIAELFSQEREHGLEDLGVQRRGRDMIEINLAHGPVRKSDRRLRRR